MGWYDMPKGNVLVTVSGGRTSGYLLHKLLEANGGMPDRAKAIFTPTGKEMPEELDFVQELASRWSVHINWVEYRCKFTGAPHDPKKKIWDSAAHTYEVVSHNSASRNGEPFLDVVKYFNYLPNREADFCSHELKTRTARRFCVNELGWKNWTASIGIRHDEKSRALKKQPKERYRVWYPLVDAKVTKRDVSAFWKAQPFDLRLADINGVTPMGNCDGCFKKAEWKRAVLARDFPDRAAWWAEQEARVGGAFREAQPWDGLIDYIDRQGDWIFDADDALCQVDDGECIG